MQRRFTVSDGMALVAAMALGLGAARSTGLHLEALGFVLGSMTWAKPLLSYEGLFLALTLLMLRLRKPRPGLRELFRQPGVAACVAISATIAFHFFTCWGDYALKPRFTRGGPDVWGYYALRFGLLASFIDEGTACPIASVWLIMALGGRWDAERSWIDRSGRALGGFWIVAALGFLLYWWFGPFWQFGPLLQFGR